MLKTVAQISYYHIAGLFLLGLVVCSTIGMTIVNYEPVVRHASLKDRQGAPALINSLSGARRVCESQIAINLKAELLGVVIDEYSTRYDERRNKFVVFMNASLGTVESPSVSRIHCHVVPGESKVDYVKVYRTNRTSYPNAIKAF